LRFASALSSSAAAGTTFCAASFRLAERRPLAAAGGIGGSAVRSLLAFVRQSSQR